MTVSKKFDVIIYGANGCMGKCAVLQAVNVLKGLKWAIAGRSEQKLQFILNETSRQTGVELTNIPIFIANAYDIIDLEVLVDKCKVLVNCCGPYKLLAENILTTCILKGTHYVDISNDPYFNELMELKYHEKAIEHKVYVISSCGFNSLPIELALNFVQQQFDGTLNQVEAFVRYNFGYYFYLPLHAIWSATAWYSLLWSCVKIGELTVIRDEIRSTQPSSLWPQQPIEELFQRRKYHEDGVMVHFPFIDQQTVERSQYKFYVQDGIRPIQFCKYIEFPNFIWAFLFIIWCLVVSILSQFTRTREIMIKYPRIFSIGMFSPKGPNFYLLEMSSYKIKLHASGWSNSRIYTKSILNNDFELNRFMDFEISGENPFYGCGSVCLLLSARTLLEELNKLPGRGGVYSPGYVFKNTNILEKFKHFQNYLRIRVV